MTLLDARIIEERPIFKVFWDLFTKTFAWIALFGFPLYIFATKQAESETILPLLFLSAIVLNFLITRINKIFTQIAGNMLVPTAVGVGMLFETAIETETIIETEHIYILSIMLIFAVVNILFAIVQKSKRADHKVLSYIIPHLSYFLAAITTYYLIMNQPDREIIFHGNTIPMNVPGSYLLINITFLAMNFFATSIQLVLINYELTEIAKKFRSISSWSLDERVIQKTIDGNSRTMEKKNEFILIGDIRGFTSFTENHPVETVVEVLENFYRIIEVITFKYLGYKPEFIADEFVTFFTNSECALNCALEIRDRANIFLDRFGLAVGMGLSTGTVLEGLIGGNISKKYTLIGRAINIAARLQANAKGWQILTIQDFLKSCPAAKYRTIGKIELKGIKEPVIAYKIIGVKKNKLYELLLSKASFWPIPNIRSFFYTLFRHKKI